MGETLSRAIQPEQLAVFKGVSAQSEINIPELAKNRKLTNWSFLVAFGVAIIFLIPFMTYSLIHSDVNRLIHGYDGCGNVCGQKNHYYAAYECSGKDFTSEKYLHFESEIVPGNNGEFITPRHCARECETGFEPILMRCMKPDSENSTQNITEILTTLKSIHEMKDYFEDNLWKVIVASFLSLGVAIVMLFLFKSITTAFVWGSLAAIFICLGVAVGWMWYRYFTYDGEATPKNGLKDFILIVSIVLLIIWLIMFFLLVCFLKRIRFVILLLKEAAKATNDMPLVTFIPLLSFFTVLLIITAAVITCFYMFSFGILRPLQEDYLYYEADAFPYFTMVVSICIALWATQFVVGIQQMVIGGAVAKWYFSRDKNYLDSPILTSTSIVFKFHLGSIAFGSLFITFIAILRAFLTALSENKNLKVFMNICLSNIESFFKYLSKNSYLLTAMHGQPFYKSGKRAAKIIFSNLLNIVTIQVVCDLVLGLAQVFIIVFSLLLTSALLQGSVEQETLAIYLTVFLVSLIAAVTTFAIFETTIDTIFLCFCEDSLLNDGMARPYAMSRNLNVFVDKWKSVYGVMEDNTN